jgi:phage-related holin
VAFDFDDVVTAWILGQVGVKQVMIHMQKIVKQLTIVLVSVTGDRLAGF